MCLYDIVCVGVGLGEEGGEKERGVLEQRERAGEKSKREDSFAALGF